MSNGKQIVVGFSHLESAKITLQTVSNEDRILENDVLQVLMHSIQRHRLIFRKSVCGDAAESCVVVNDAVPRADIALVHCFPGDIDEGNFRDFEAMRRVNHFRVQSKHLRLGVHRARSKLDEAIGIAQQVSLVYMLHAHLTAFRAAAAGTTSPKFCR